MFESRRGRHLFKMVEPACPSGLPQVAGPGVVRPMNKIERDRAMEAQVELANSADTLRSSARNQEDSARSPDHPRRRSHGASR